MRNNNKIMLYILALYALLGFGSRIALADNNLLSSSTKKTVLLAPLFVDRLVPLSVDRMEEKEDARLVPIVFKHGDISWLPKLAQEAGWPQKTWKRLGNIILRESGGCPNRRGGDIVDKNCNIIGHDGSNHRSDSGLLQINGVNYDTSRNKWALLCRELDICEQAPLLDAYTNLVAGKALWDAAGWGPWNPCAWGPEHRPKSCK